MKLHLATCAVLVTAGALHAQELDEEPPPATWAQVGTRYQTECPAPFFTFKTKETFTAGGHTFDVLGSTWVRQGAPLNGMVKLGVLGAIKEASPETRENLARAMKEFKKQGVQFVVANGDISEGEFDLQDAFNMLGAEIQLPVFLYIGNSEGKGSFTRAYLKAAKDHPHLINMNWVRHADLGGIHLLSLPGYYNTKYLHGSAGCRYVKKDVLELQRLVNKLQGKGPLILTSHGPPRSFGAAAIDVAFDAGNVGDPDMTDLIINGEIPFGIFGHILEAGGRVTSDLKTGTPVKLPMKKGADALYFNAGSVSATPWAMLKGPPSYGMAAIFSLEAGKGKVEFFTLRKQ